MRLKELFGLLLSCLQIVVGNGSCQPNSLALHVFFVDFSAKFLEQTLQQLFLVEHDFHNRRANLCIPQHEILLGSHGCLLGLMESHVTNNRIVFIEASDQLLGVHLDLFVTFVVPGTNEVTQGFGVDPF